MSCRTGQRSAHGSVAHPSLSQVHRLTRLSHREFRGMLHFRRRRRDRNLEVAGSPRRNPPLQC
eukprot:162682-Pyramimonas_sp.AAC.1